MSPGTVASQLPPASAAKSTTTDPCFITASISLVINFGAGFPGMRACGEIRAESGDEGDQTNSGDYDVNLPALFFEQGHFCSDEFLRHDLRISTYTATIFLDIDF